MSLTENERIRIRLKADDYLTREQSAREIVDTARRTGARIAVPTPGNHPRPRNNDQNQTVLEQLVILKDHTDLPPVRRNLAALNTLSVLLVDNHLPTRRSFDQSDQSQKSALARS